MVKKRVEKAFCKMASSIFEYYAFVWDLTAFPIGRKKQENFIRKCYMASNRVQKLVGGKQKVFKRINSKGEIEEII